MRASTPPSPTVLLRNARLVGRDGAPTDLLIEDGIVAAIAPDLRTAHAEVVDLEGRWVMPGLWDHHVHFDQWSLVRQRLDVTACESAREVVEVVAARLRENRAADADLLVAYGYRDGLWPDVPTAAALDAVSGDVPVAVMSADLHAVWLNTRGLEFVGFAGGGDRGGGGGDVRGIPGASGVPVGPGVLREGDAFDACAILTATDDEQMDRWAGEAASEAAKRGVVGIVDLEMSLGIERWVRRVSAGVDQLRVRLGVYPERLDEVIARGLKTGDPIDGSRGLLTMGPFKVITDGSLGTRTAYCHDAYPGLEGEPGAFGLSTVALPDLIELLARASEAGLVPAVHAIGDRAVDDVLTAFETVGCEGSIEHAQLIASSSLARFARSGLVASVQPEHAMDDRDIADHYWVGRTSRAFALESLHGAGVPLRLGSDAPVAPLDPWISMSAAVSRSRDGREPWHPEQRVLTAVALAASTGGALAVEESTPADLAVVDTDPLAASGEELRSFPVSATLLGGRFTHRSL